MIEENSKQVRTSQQLIDIHYRFDFTYLSFSDMLLPN